MHDRSRRTPDAHYAGIWLAVMLFGMFASLAGAAGQGDPLPGDRLMQAMIRAWRHPALDYPMHVVSELGSGRFLIPLNIVVVYSLWRWKYRHVFLIPLVGVLAVIFEAFTKWVVQRPRPKNVGYGFPSGHVFGAVVIFGLIVYLVWHACHRRGVTFAAGALAALAVCAVGLSRLYFNSHWFTDIFGGLVGGLAILLGAIIVCGPSLYERTDAPRTVPRYMNESE